MQIYLAGRALPKIVSRPAIALPTLSQLIIWTLPYMISATKSDFCSHFVMAAVRKIVNDIKTGYAIGVTIRR